MYWVHGAMEKSNISSCGPTSAVIIFGKALGVDHKECMLMPNLAAVSASGCTSIGATDSNMPIQTLRLTTEKTRQCAVRGMRSELKQESEASNFSFVGPSKHVNSYTASLHTISTT
jgi:hypothetical protein